MTTTHHDAKSNTGGPKQPPEVSREGGWGHVDEASWESFPASDSPAHSAGAEGAPPTLNGEPYTEAAVRSGDTHASSRGAQLRAKADELKQHAERRLDGLRTRLHALADSVRERLHRH